jgi:type II secretory pathway component HofQ
MFFYVVDSLFTIHYFAGIKIKKNDKRKFFIWNQRFIHYLRDFKTKKKATGKMQIPDTISKNSGKLTRGTEKTSREADFTPRKNRPAATLETEKITHNNPSVTHPKTKKSYIY